jgi:hypothetical protein
LKLEDSWRLAREEASYPDGYERIITDKNPEEEYFYRTHSEEKILN